MLFLFFKQKTAYDMRISDWSSDVCSSDLQFTSAQMAESDKLLVWVNRLSLFCGIRLIAVVRCWQTLERVTQLIDTVHANLAGIKARGSTQPLVEQPHHSAVERNRSNLRRRKSTRLNSSH